MNREFLLPESSLREAGTGPELFLGKEPDPVSVTVEVSRATEKESLEISIWGSDNGVNWTPVAKLPRLFYCGTYRVPLHLDSDSVKYLKAEWQVDRWMTGEGKPLFTTAISVERGDALALAAGHAAAYQGCNLPS